MKKFLLLFILIGLPLHAATVEYFNDNEKVTLAQIQTVDTGIATENFNLGPYESAGIQCVWASVSGVQPIYKLQVSNDNTNWDDVSGASKTTTGSSGSSTWLVSPIAIKYARVFVSTTSTSGTLDCTGVLQR